MLEQAPQVVYAPVNGKDGINVAVAQLLQGGQGTHAILADQPARVVLKSELNSNVKHELVAVYGPGKDALRFPDKTASIEEVLLGPS